MKRAILTVVCLTSLFLPAAYGQPSASAPKPIVAAPSGNFTLDVKVKPEFVPEADPEFPERRLRSVRDSIRIKQYGGIRNDVTSWSDGSTSRIWRFADQSVSVIQNRQEGSAPLLLRDGYTTGLVPYVLRFDKKSLAWITESNKQEEMPDYIHYKARVMVTPPTPEDPPGYAILQAWIDPETRQILRLHDEDALYELNSDAKPPTGPLVVPAAVEAELQLWARESQPKKRR